MYHHAGFLKEILSECSRLQGPCIMSSWFSGNNILNWYLIYFPFLLILLPWESPPLRLKIPLLQGEDRAWFRTKKALFSF
jgi:hypothetical protein